MIDHRSCIHNLNSCKSRLEWDSNPWPQRYRRSVLSAELVSQLGARTCFSKVPKSPRTRKAIAKSQTLWLQSCSIHIFLFRDSLATNVLGVYTSPFLDTDELKMALLARNVSWAYDKWVPGHNFVCWKFVSTIWLLMVLTKPYEIVLIDNISQRKTTATLLMLCKLLYSRFTRQFWRPKIYVENKRGTARHQIHSKTEMPYAII